jgi:large subunit ribosomal protein L19e
MGPRTTEQYELTILFRNQIHRAKAEKARERQIKEEMDAKRARTKAARERKQERQAAKRNALTGELEEEETK